MEENEYVTLEQLKKLALKSKANVDERLSALIDYFGLNDSGGKAILDNSSKGIVTRVVS